MLRVFATAIFRSGETRLVNCGGNNVRKLVSSATPEANKVPTLDDVNDLFAEARLCLQE